jgi:integrase
MTLNLNPTSPKTKGVKIVRRKLADGTIRVHEYKQSSYVGKRNKPVVAVDTSKHVDVLIHKWQETSKWNSLSKNTKANYLAVSKNLYDRFNGMDIATVDREKLNEMRDFIETHKGSGAASVFARVTTTFFNWCQRRGVEIHKNGNPAVALITDVNKGGELSAWTLDQALKAEAELPRQYSQAVKLARLTGQRRGDLVKMRWSDYDGKYINVKQEKTGVSVAIPVKGELKRTLDQWKAETNGLTILQKDNGRPLSASSLSKGLSRHLAEIGFPPLLSIHGLRKLFCKLLKEKGKTDAQIMAITGHKTTSMVRHYSKSADQKILADMAIDDDVDAPEEDLNAVIAQRDALAMKVKELEAMLLAKAA